MARADFEVFFAKFNKDIDEKKAKQEEIKKAVKGMDMTAVQNEVEEMAKEVLKESIKSEEEEEEEEYGPGDVQALVETLTYIWNSLGDDEIDTTTIKDRIEKAIPTQFEDENVVSERDDGEEENLDEDVIVQKRIYMCGKCKKRGQQVPKKGHVCPNKAN